MSVLDRIASLLGVPEFPEFPAAVPMQARAAASFTLDNGLTQLLVGGRGNRPWTPPTIAEALSVPAIQRAVTLISNTMGSLTLRQYEDGREIELSRMMQRPDPYSIPRDFFRDQGYCMSTRGEVINWIASRDQNGLPSALIVVPPRELKIEENPDNRLFPKYSWGDKVGTRFSAANPTGEFLHITYLKEPGKLRGVGPLQLAQAATSVSVEAQEWAASFFAEGGMPSMVIRSNVPLSGDPSTGWQVDPDDESETISEAEAFLNAWQAKPHNVPRVAGPEVGEIDYPGINEQGAQMLSARDYQNGDAARQFGIPGVLLEYSTAGSSLTYQNIADVFSLFVKSSLAPNYLEPVEQWLSDLLPRRQSVRFDVEGFLRADAKTRFEIYKLAFDAGIPGAQEWAATQEGLLPGSVETRPIAPAPPAATPSSLPQVRTAIDQADVRCDGMTLKRRGGIQRLEPCGALLSRTGSFTGTCRRCKKVHGVAA